MLLNLNIKNIALIEDVSVDFRKGFHVLTGETGAGKSIVVDALNLIIGNRADRGLIRSGSDRAFVEASILIKDVSVVRKKLLEELGVNDEVMLVSRTITTSGRNICRINGETVSLQLLQEIMRLLIDIHGQHSYQFLMDAENHRIILDRFGDENHERLLNKLNLSYEDWHQSSLQLKKLFSLKKEREMQFDYVSKQLKELDNLNLSAGEEEYLYQKKSQIESAVKVRDALKLAYYNLYGFANDDSILQKLRETHEEIGSISALNPEFEELFVKLKNIYFDLEDITNAIRSLKENNDYSEKEEFELADRLDQIKKAKRKYGEYPEITNKHKMLQEKMDSYVSLDDKLKLQEKNYKENLQKYRETAAEISLSRKQIANTFEVLLIKQLQELGMEDIQFKTMFSPSDIKMVPSPTGNDKIEFFISPNLGEPLKSLSSTASGGELSRIMLAIKTIEADKNKVPCMIFDEVDSGISGKAAQVVAEKIAMISNYRQVLAVSHLAQIASMADVHYFVEKEAAGERTITTVLELSGQEREKEVARLLGIVRGNEATGLKHAANMLDGAKKFKESLQVK